MGAVRLVLMYCVVLLVSASAHMRAEADTIKFTYGAKKKCVIIEEDEKWVTFLSPYGEVKVSRGQIESIKRESDEVNEAFREQWGVKKAETSRDAEVQAHSPGLVIRYPLVYRVKMETKFVVPAQNEVIDELRVWHALPTLRPWSNVTDEVGASEITWSSSGEQLYEEKHDSHHVFWNKAGRLKPGTAFEFTSRFTVRSVQREFNPEKARVRWKDYDELTKDETATVDPALTKNVHPKIADLADGITMSMPPPLAVREFCKWIKKTIKYDAGVSYPPSDVASILKNCRGHCGHQCALLEQLCARSGIPFRRVWGLNLCKPTGKGELYAVRADYTNIHTWAEVYFPGIGWIEVEPNKGKEAYFLPARLVQNNRWFQNYSIWIREEGQWKRPTWSYKGGKYISDYGVEHLITYSVGKK